MSSNKLLKQFDFYREPGYNKHERVPLLHNKSKTGLEVVTAMQYEDILSSLEGAMKRGDREEAREQAAQLTTLGQELRYQPGLAAYLERGRWKAAARDRLRQQYVQEFVMLRGGGPYDTQPQQQQDQQQPFLTAQDPSAQGQGPPPDPGDGYLTELTEPHIRHGFVQKVYGILFVQLLVTAIVGGLTMTLLQGASEGAVSICMWLSFIVLVTTMCVFTCNPSLMKTFPQNYIILLVFTLAESALVGVIGTRYTAESVLVVVAITAVVVLGLSLFACQTSYDFSGAGPYLLCALLVMTALSFAFLFAAILGMASSPAFQLFRLVFAGFGALLFSFYIIYDTQLIMGGKHTTEFGTDDYCFAAISLYMDIIQLFIYLLELFGDRR